MIKRSELLSSKEYWLTRIQVKLHSLLKDYMKKKSLNQTQLADKLGVSKGYVSQILNGNFDYRLSKFIELSLAIEKVPEIDFVGIQQIINDDEMGVLYEEERFRRPVINLSVKYKGLETEHIVSKNYPQHDAVQPKVYFLSPFGNKDFNKKTFIN